MRTPMLSCRPLTDWGRRLILRLLSGSFPGRDARFIQLPDAVCTPLRENGAPLENGGLFLKTASTATASVKKGVPTEGEALPTDGVTIPYLWHVYNGKIGGGEVFKEDFSKLPRHAEPEEWEVTVADGWPSQGFIFGEGFGSTAVSAGSCSSSLRGRGGDEGGA